MVQFSYMVEPVERGIATQTVEPPRNPPPPDRHARETAWNAMKTRIDRIIDGEQRGIDEGIKEPVIALKLLGVNTSQSCEGHLPTADNSSLYPYVSIEAEGAEALSKRVSESGLLANKLFAEHADPEVIRKLADEHSALLTELRRVNLRETKKVMGLLAEFYAVRQPTPERRLIAHVEGTGNCRIKPQGGDLQDLEDSPHVQEERLKQYQEEMREFGSFLKEKYFNQ